MGPIEHHGLGVERINDRMSGGASDAVNSGSQPTTEPATTTPFSLPPPPLLRQGGERSVVPVRRNALLWVTAKRSSVPGISANHGDAKCRVARTVAYRRFRSATTDRKHRLNASLNPTAGPRHKTTRAGFPFVCLNSARTRHSDPPLVKRRYAPGYRLGQLSSAQAPRPVPVTACGRALREPHVMTRCPTPRFDRKRATMLHDNDMQYLDHHGTTSMSNHLVQARIDRQVKEEAATVLAAMGLTVSDAPSAYPRCP